MVTGDHSSNPVPPLRTVQLDSRSVVGAEVLGRLYLTKVTKPPPLQVALVHRGTALYGLGRFGEAIAALARAEHMAAETGDKRAEGKFRGAPDGVQRGSEGNNKHA
eukprot:9317571-Pyramimonas_sp.AAC.1